jgi:hypothetical protein
MVTAVESPP